MFRTLLIATLLLSCLVYAQGLENRNFPHDLEIAIQSAENGLSNEIFKILPDKIEFLREISLRPNCEDTFHAVDIGVLANRFSLWREHLPNIVPYYAVKTNNDPIIVSVLASLGAGFDCASANEIEQVLKLGVDPSKIIFAHPRKSNSSILYAKEQNVNLITLDSLEELDKLSMLYPEANFLIRIKTNDSLSSSQLSQKFGATLAESYEILDAAFAKNLKIIGVAFHVGSNCKYIESYRQAIMDAAELFEYSKTCWNKDLSLLDLGGGWPGTDDHSFVEIAQTVNELIQTNFSPQTQFIAEPGRYFAAKTTTLAMRVLGKKKLKNENKIVYYLSNGVFGFFITSLYYDYNMEKILSEGWIIKPLNNCLDPNTLYPSLLWGPTCDSGDKIMDGILLPEIQTGDFLVVENIGAYSKSLETPFNGIPFSKAYYILESKDP